MSLSTMNNVLLRSRLLYQLLNRSFGQATLGARPKPARISWRPPASEQGYFEYERDFSRDDRYTDPPKKGDTWKRYLRIHAHFVKEFCYIDVKILHI